jgi:hypothetical protein
MRKQKNKRSKLSRASFTQTIIETPEKKNGKPNLRYPGHKTIVHTATVKP